ncbi:transmembrane protease serine 2-like [Solea senegalensis]|uniref:Transmembrane protease serine 2-like n=2 Tax=Solea senegalensis TaxID=28829 RepID=A0AAV6PVH3_SOLSE|nr:transmembrane protease serine 2-like isoform X1 [Solea senegalensis]KAG7479023.1 transmembrane protease serine 2-like [Solea senegalensis]
MTTDLYLDSSRCFIHEDGEWKHGQEDVKPQYVHHMAPTPPPEFSHSVPPKKDANQRCASFTVTVVLSLMLLLLVTGILLGYYFSSSCVHGRQCGDGSCVWEYQWCDGVMDCPAGQDEAHCVRLRGSSFLLQMYSAETKSWKSVCTHGWTEQQGKASCRTFGYSRDTYFKSGQQRTDTDDGFLIVKSGFNPDAFILHQLVPSKFCPNNSVVTLRCTDCGSGVNSSTASRGQQASLGSWPWQVSLQVSGSHRCGGAIISPYWIVTAAHCMARDSNPGDWAVYAGIVDPLGSLFNPAHTVSHIIAHEGFNRLTRTNDIALMRLTKALDLTGSRNIGAVCLPDVGLNFTVPQKGWITPFVRTANEDAASAHLMEAQVSLIDDAECNSFSAYNGKISRDMFCAREMEAGTNTCQTDSGGPLVSLKDGLWWLEGDIIWGEHCAEKSKPGVFGNVTYFLDWIHLQMKMHQDE